jgi:4-oxalocrotonate tautomerase family enzyme
MPYVHVALTIGRSSDQKRSLIRAITDSIVRVLEVGPRDVHVFLWEFTTENAGVAGEEPGPTTINDVTIILRQGRHLEVKALLIKDLTDTIGKQLDIPYEDVHIILSEVPASNIGEGGVPMKSPAQPAWHMIGQAVPQTAAS